VSLNQWIARLSESDKIIKENEKLKKQNSDIRNEVKLEKEKINNEYENKNSAMQADIEEIARLKNEIEEASSNQNKIIEAKACKRYELKNKSLYTAICALILYSLGITIFESIQSDLFFGDLKSFIINFVYVCMFIPKFFYNSATLAGNYIYLVYCFVCVISFIIECYLFRKILICVYKTCINIIFCYVDMAIILLILSFNIFFGSTIKSIISINLISLFFVMSFLYIFTRWCIKQWRDS